MEIFTFTEIIVICMVQRILDIKELNAPNQL